MIAAVLRELMAAGVMGDALVVAIERIEQSMDRRSPGAKRQARYRANQASQSVTNVTSVTGDGTPSQVSPSFSPPNTPSITTPSSPSPSSLRSEVVGSGEPTRSPKKYSPAFEGWWLAYPKTPVMSKKDAGAAWARLSDDDRLRAISAIAPYRAFLAGKPDHPVVHACRFLSQRRFDGFADIEAAATGPPTPPRPDLPSDDELRKRYADKPENPQGTSCEIPREGGRAPQNEGREIRPSDHQARIGGMASLGAIFHRVPGL